MRSHTRTRTLNLTKTHLGQTYEIWRQGFGWNRDNGKPWWYVKFPARWHIGPYVTRAQAIEAARKECEKVEVACIPTE